MQGKKSDTRHFLRMTNRLPKDDFVLAVGYWVGSGVDLGFGKHPRLTRVCGPAAQWLREGRFAVVFVDLSTCRS